MRSVLSIGLTAIFYVALTATSAVPLEARPEPAPMGSILQAVRGNRNLEMPGAGNTIYAGDQLETASDERLRAQLGDSQLSLWENTVVDVGGLQNDPSATLVSGTVDISTPESRKFHLLADGITIRPLGAQRSVAHVTFVNAHELEITSISGGFQLSIGADVQTIEKGESYRIEIETENPGPHGSAGSSKGAKPTGRSHFTKYLIAGGAIATVVGTWRALISPCAP